MMKTRHNIYCFFILCLCACDQGNYYGGENNTLRYHYTTIAEKAPDCPSNTDNGCTIIKFSYPVFKGQEKLNDTIVSKLAKMFPVFNNSRTDFHEIAKSFFVRYKNYLAVDPQKPAFYPLNEYAKVAKQDPGLVTIETGGYLLATYKPLSNISFINWDTQSNKIIGLNDLFKPGFQDLLNKAAEGIFRKNLNLTDTEPLDKKYTFKGGKFALNKNFLVTPFGIRFLFNEGEIQPRSGGFTIIMVPYSNIKSILKSQTVVTQYIR